MLSYQVPPLKTDANGTISVRCVDAKGEKVSRISFDNIEIKSHGTFGIVYRARMINTGEICAIKKVAIDLQFKTREASIARILDHKNVCKLKALTYRSEMCSFKSHHKSVMYLYLIMEHVSDSVHELLKCARLKNNKQLPLDLVRSITKQMFSALTYIHKVGICHRDIKPQNLLFDRTTGTVKLCDFGSAKNIVPGEKSSSYICTRMYRALELMLGYQDYDHKIDIWSAGCVFVELLTCKPLFSLRSGGNQIKRAFNLSRAAVATNSSKSNAVSSWNLILESRFTPEIMDIVRATIAYPPSYRREAIDIMAMPLLCNFADPTDRPPNTEALSLLLGPPLPSERNTHHPTSNAAIT